VAGKVLKNRFKGDNVSALQLSNLPTKILQQKLSIAPKQFWQAQHP